jgi:hypothetical protein
MLHKQITLVDRHPPHSYEYATITDRTSATGFLASDLGKIAWQKSDNTFWVLTAVTPTWSGIGSGGGGALDDLTDVIITTPSNGQVLKFNGSEWVNDADSTGTSSGGDSTFASRFLLMGA